MNTITMNSMGTEYVMTAEKPMANVALNQFVRYGHSVVDGHHVYTFVPQPSSSFIIQSIIDSTNNMFTVSENAQSVLDENYELAIKPIAYLHQGTHISMECPPIPYYRQIMEMLGARETGFNRFLVALSRSFEVIRMLGSMRFFLPNFTIDESLQETLLAPLESFDGTLSSLFKGEITDLFTVNNAYKAKPENFLKMGYDSPISFALTKPIRYIDKTKVTHTEEWRRDEEVTFIGKVVDKEEINFQHAKFTFQVGEEQVDAIFYRRKWMISKFPIGEEVLVIAKFTGRRAGRIQLGGSSMDSLIEAQSLPIVPIYSQSQKNLINTKIIMNVVYELFTRMGPVTKDIAGYIDSSGLGMSLRHAIQSLHFPKDIEDYKTALNVLAFYELVYMQLLIIHRKATEEKKKGLPKPHVPGGLVEQAVSGLPFTLTDSQKKAMKNLQGQLASDSAEQALISADVGAGKALLETERVATPTGWKQMKDLKVGDKVLGRDGKPTNVTGVFPQGERELAKLTFSDGTWIICDLDHLWELERSDVYDDKYVSGKRPSYTISTRELLMKEKSPQKVNNKNKHGEIVSVLSKNMETHFKKTSGASRWRLPLMSSPAEFEVREPLPLHPYLLGYWLGDGTSRILDFAVGNDDLENFISLATQYWDGEISCAADKRSNCHNVRLRNVNFEATKILKDEDLFMNKHIPEKYLLSSPESRLELLQGLIDSDGSTSPKGSITFGNTNEKIIEGIIELVQSLGGTAKRSNAKFKTYENSAGEKVATRIPSWNVTINLPTGMSPSQLPRKLNNYNPNEIKKRSHRLIRTLVNVEKLNYTAKTICIKVDSHDELFLTKDYIVTHNTILAQLTCLQAVDNKYQAVLAAPTEVLANQLYGTFKKVLEGIPQRDRPSIAFLSGSLKAKEKREVHKAIEYGEVDIIVGTHSVLNAKVPYKNLGVVCIDEQQKFGASQRNALLNIREDSFMPDIISQTATPIPRSTAQIYYGDINLITVDQKPSGRKEIITEWIKDDPREIITKKASPVWSDISSELALGHKAFVVVPMVHENAKVNAASVAETIKELSKILPNVEIEFVHGQMKKAEQEERIENFRTGSANLLVASTVIEVGVDIPEATRMVILSADRLGASSLHQIRGRVGRNSLQSKCYLVSSNTKVDNTARLESLVNSNNGFEIAKVDLHTRGEGDLFGERQAGDTKLTFASLVNHATLIDEARAVAESIYKTPRKIEALMDAEAILKSDEEE